MKIESAKKIDEGELDARYSPKPPQGGLVVRVHGKVLSGYPDTDDKHTEIFQSATSRDNLWMTAKEHQALVRGEVPRQLQERIARFHLTDATRGEPPMWKQDQIKQLEITIKGTELSGNVHLETADGKRGYVAEIFGEIMTSGEKVTQLRAVAKGEFWGHGRYTRNPPPGKFPLAIRLTLADQSDVADAIPPQASRGWVRGYLEN